VLATAHPETLATDYLPPVLIGRREELARAAVWLGTPWPSRPGPWCLKVVGPSGSGTSAVARGAARDLAESLRRERTGPPPLLVTVRVRWCRGAQGVAAAMLQHLDDGFRAQGFHVAEILAGFLRRLTRENRPAIVVLDDISPSAPDLSPLWRAFAHPDRFLPEGSPSSPPLWVVLAGVPEATGTWSQVERSALDPAAPLRIAPYPPAVTAAIVRDRLTRALGRMPPEATERRILDRLSGGAPNIARAVELVRRELLGREAVSPGSIYRPRGAPDRVVVEARLVRAIALASPGPRVPIGEIRGWEQRLARQEGVGPMPATTLWRRLHRLEAEGLIRRSVRTGGAGGTRSEIDLLRPVSDWPVPPSRPGTLPVDGIGGASPPLLPG
jgi:hypothetical protein